MYCIAFDQCITITRFFVKARMTIILYILILHDNRVVPSKRRSLLRIHNSHAHSFQPVYIRRRAPSLLSYYLFVNYLSIE